MKKTLEIMFIYKCMVPEQGQTNPCGRRPNALPCRKLGQCQPRFIIMPPTLKKWGTYWFRLVRVCVCVCVCVGGGQ